MIESGTAVPSALGAVVSSDVYASRSIAGAVLSPVSTTAPVASERK